MTQDELEKLSYKIGKTIGNIVGLIGLLFFITWLVQLVWNAIIPEVFLGPSLTYWQSLGLMFLTNVFFKGINNNYKK